MKSKHRDRSVELVIASVGVQGLLIGVAAALTVAVTSQSQGQPVQNGAGIPVPAAHKVTGAMCDWAGGSKMSWDLASPASFGGKPGVAPPDAVTFPGGYTANVQPKTRLICGMMIRNGVRGIPDESPPMGVKNGSLPAASPRAKLRP
jgi:hypothetical protein